MQHLARFEELLSDFFERRGGDYQTLLPYGRLWRDDVEDPQDWRREIRAQARRGASVCGCGPGVASGTVWSAR